MRPFIWHGRSGPWYVDVSREQFTTLPGTDWFGYDTLGDAMDAALAALAEPA